MRHFVIGLAMAATLAGCSRGGGSPEAVVEDLVRRTEAGDCKGLGDSFSASSRQMIGPKMEEACRMGAEQRKSDPAKAKEKSLKTLHVLEKKEEGDRATVRFQPEMNDGTRAEAQTFVLVKEEGKWRIDLLATGMASGAGQDGAPGMAPGAPPAMTPTPPMATPPVAMPPSADAPADEAVEEEAEETN